METKHLNRQQIQSTELRWSAERKRQIDRALNMSNRSRALDKGDRDRV